jgi:peptide/nickel transport system substrate-binding protein
MLLVVLTSVTVVLAGCTASPPAGTVVDRSSLMTAPASMSWAFEQEFSSYNLNTPDGGMQANLVVLNGVLSGFYQFGPDGTIIPNTDFGRYQKIADSPLTVRYVISDKAVWSDGVPISCEDVVFAWLAQSGVTGKKGFAVGSALGMEDMNKPQCVPGGKTVTITYKNPFADWAAQFGVTTIMPSHIVAREGGLTKSFLEYADHPLSSDLAKAENFYNKGWLLKPGELKRDLMPSSGPYLIDSWVAGQSITLKANPRWWGRPARTKTVIIRFIAGTAQPQALQNGEIQAMDPQPQTDLVRQLRALGDDIHLAVGEAFRYEHLDFSFKGAFRDRSLREAFAKCVPRQQIVDNLVRPQNPNAKIMESRFIYPFQRDYAVLARGVGGDRYDRVDLAGSRRLLAGRTPTVRFGWYKDSASLNKRRADTIALIRSSCERAGFKIVDVGSPTFLDREWVDGNFDVALFSWNGSPMVTGNNDYFRTGGGLNPTGYGNPQVDRLLARLVREPDRLKQLPVLLRIDRLLWADLATIPLFAFPSVLATAKDVQGVQYNATVVDLTWNVAEWTRS